MPRATDVTEEKVELKTLEGGIVTIRRMTYGEKMKRQGMMQGMKFTSSRKGDMQGELNLANQRVTEFEFATCVGEHNLEDEEGKILDFRRPQDLQKLNGRIGEEIAYWIDKLNQFEDPDSGNSESGSGT